MPGKTCPEEKFECPKMVSTKRSDVAKLGMSDWRRWGGKKEGGRAR
jgi:hypothetical protein